MRPRFGKKGGHGGRDKREQGRHERHDRSRHRHGHGRGEPAPQEPARQSNAETRWVGGIEAVSAALSSQPYDCRMLWVEHELQNDAIGDLVRRAKDLGVDVQFMGRPELDRAVQGGKHQGVALRVVYDPMETFAEWIRSLDESRKKGLVIVALDQIQDPHNLGAIARSALQLGARCLVAPERRSSPVTTAAIQSSAGAVLKIPVHRVVNLAQTLALCKENGFWVYGADAAGKDAWDATLNTPCVLVIGSEGYGLRPLVRASCEELLRIPQVAHGVGSLNASCAATALLYEIARQKAKPAR